MSVRDEGSEQCSSKSLGHRCDVRASDAVGGQDRELILSKVRQRVSGAEGALDPPVEGLQQLIPGRVPERVGMPWRRGRDRHQSSAASATKSMAEMTPVGRPCSSTATSRCRRSSLMRRAASRTVAVLSIVTAGVLITSPTRMPRSR